MTRMKQSKRLDRWESVLMRLQFEVSHMVHVEVHLSCNFPPLDALRQYNGDLDRAASALMMASEDAVRDFWLLGQFTSMLLPPHRVTSTPICQPWNPCLRIPKKHRPAKARRRHHLVRISICAPIDIYIH